MQAGILWFHRQRIESRVLSRKDFGSCRSSISELDEDNYRMMRVMSDGDAIYNRVGRPDFESHPAIDGSQDESHEDHTKRYLYELSRYGKRK